MAKQVRGYRSQMVMGFESDYGKAAETPTGWVMPFNTESIAIGRNKNTAATLRGTRNPAEPFDGNTEVSGDITVPVDAQSFGLWLRAIFGAPVSTAQTESVTPEGGGDPVETPTGVYTHVFTSGEEMPSIWLESFFAADVPFYKRTHGVKINSFSMDCGGDQELTATLSCMGGVQQQVDAPLVDAPEEMGLDRLSNFMASLKIDDVEFGDATSFSVNLDNGLDGDTYTIGGGGFRGDLPEGLMGVSGSMTVLLKDSELYKKALASTPMKLELALTKANGAGLTFTLPQTQLQVTGPVTDGPAGLRLTWNYQAYSPAATDPALIVTLTNTQAEYED